MNTTPATVDRYVRGNVIALAILENQGHSEFNGISRRTIRAFARRGLVHDLGDGRAIVTPEGSAAVEAHYDAVDEADPRA